MTALEFVQLGYGIAPGISKYFMDEQLVSKNSTDIFNCSCLYVYPDVY